MNARISAAIAIAFATTVACASSEPAPTFDTSPTEPDASSPSDGASQLVDGGPAAPDATTSDASSCPAPCGVAPQCGCFANETCAPDPKGDLSCVAAGTLAPGRACLSTRECAVGLLCVLGVCRAPCAAEGSTCAGGGSCRSYASVPDAGSPAAPVLACPVTCAYDDEGSCGFAKGALLAAACVYDAQTADVDCARVSEQQIQSGACTADPACGAGRVCVPQSGGYSSCRRLCKVGDPAACGGCKALTPARVVAGVTYGACP